MSGIYGSGSKGRATKLPAELVRRRGRCEACGSTSNLQCAHVISRRYSATRTDETNAYCLCAGCHMRFTTHADEWMDFVDRTIGRAEYDRLKAKALSNLRPWKQHEWQAEVDRLSALLREAA